MTVPGLGISRCRLVDRLTACLQAYRPQLPRYNGFLSVTFLLLVAWMASPDSPVCDTTIFRKLIRRQGPLKEAFLYWDMYQSTGNIRLRLPGPPLSVAVLERGIRAAVGKPFIYLPTVLTMCLVERLARLSWSTLV
jgi:hypothetical protein